MQKFFCSETAVNMSFTMQQYGYPLKNMPSRYTNEIIKAQLRDSQILYNSFINREKLLSSFPNIFLATMNNTKLNHLK